MVDLDRKDKLEKKEPTTNNDKHLKQLRFIADNTHEELKLPLAISEAIVASTPMEHWKKPYSGKDNEGNVIRMENIGEKETSVLDIYRLLKESYRHTVKAVVDTIKPYSIEYRATGTTGAGFDIPDWMGGASETGDIPQ